MMKIDYVTLLMAWMRFGSSMLSTARDVFVHFAHLYCAIQQYRICLNNYSMHTIGVESSLTLSSPLFSQANKTNQQ